MAFDRKCWHLTWGGGLPGGEIWSSGLKIAHDHDWAAEVQIGQSVFDNLVDNVNSYFTSNLTQISPRVSLGWIKLAALGGQGEYLGAAFEHDYITRPVGGGQGTAKYPNQVAQVVTLWSGGQFGRANYGRWYNPPVTSDLNTDGRISSADALNHANAAATFVSAINSTCATTLGAPVVQILSGVGAGTGKVVTAVRVGTVLDTIRRRRNQLVEAPQQVAV